MGSLSPSWTCDMDVGYERQVSRKDGGKLFPTAPASKRTTHPPSRSLEEDQNPKDSATEAILYSILNPEHHHHSSPWPACISNDCLSFSSTNNHCVFPWKIGIGDKARVATTSVPFDVPAPSRSFVLSRFRRLFRELCIIWPVDKKPSITSNLSRHVNVK